MAKVQTQSLIYQCSKFVSCNASVGDHSVEQIDLGYSIRDLLVMRIKKVAYYLTLTNLPIVTFGASADQFSFGLSQDFHVVEASVAANPDDLAIVDYNSLFRGDCGTAANAIFFTDPMIVKTMMDIHPDGLPVHPASLYAWSYCNNAAAATFDYRVVIHYDIQEITMEYYQQLINQLLINR